MTRKKNNHRNKSGSILHVKNSRSKSVKHIKRGRKGKDCVYFNTDKLSCDNIRSPYHKQFCKLCSLFTPVEKNNELSEYDENYIQLPHQAAIHESTTENIKLSRDIGTPVHVGYLKKTDTRRHKARCIYIDKATKMCKWFMRKCTSSSRCEKYRER